MLTGGWQGLSVLYVCPIKALLNNLDARLGRRSALWHGDIATGQKKALLRDPPDCLLTTPESLEAMLVSPGVEARPLFAGLRAVIVDEVHAFAGDDRGWHLLGVLSRIGRQCGRHHHFMGCSRGQGASNLSGAWGRGPVGRLQPGRQTAGLGRWRPDD
jgi:ATP-dependent Lhr-like helicase